MRLLVGRQGAPYRYVTADYAPPEGDDVAFTGPHLPDLTDPATLGALLALVREAGCYIRHLSVLPMGSTVNVEYPDGRICDYRRATLGEALVAALEAAP